MQQICLYLTFILMFAVPAIHAQTTAEDYYKRGFDELMREKKYDEAIADFTKVIELNPNYDQAYFWRGHARRNLSDYDGAIADMTKAFELNPKYLFSLLGRGGIKLDRKNFEGAITDFTKGIELFQDSTPFFYEYRGRTYLEMNKFDSAIADLTKVIEIYPKDIIAYYLRAKAYEKIGEKDKAEADRKKWAELSQK